MKCLYKYVYKGHDRVIHGIQNDEIEDEVVNFQESIYISSSEACWRIFQFEMHRNYPNITRLAVHLKNQQNCTFDVNGNVENILNNSNRTKLTEWFKINLIVQQHET